MWLFNCHLENLIVFFLFEKRHCMKSILGIAIHFVLLCRIYKMIPLSTPSHWCHQPSAVFLSHFHCHLAEILKLWSVITRIIDAIFHFKIPKINSFSWSSLVEDCNIDLREGMRVYKSKSDCCNLFCWLGFKWQ
jgi:hypothetical protein